MFKQIGFIGAGAVGKSLGKFLYLKGEPVAGYYSRLDEDSKMASESVRGQAYGHISDLLRACDCIAITVNDDAIDSLVEAITSLEVNLKGKFIFHTSGAHFARLLDPLAERGADICSIHPLQAFTTGEISISHLQEMYCSVEGPAVNIAISFLRKLELKYMILSEVQKKAYHMGAVVVSNFMVPLIAEGVEIFKTFGLSGSEAFDALKPLIEGTLNNIQKLGVEKALTGPYARGDISTVRSHLSVTMEPDQSHFYMENAKHTLQFIKKTQGLTPAQEEICALLEEVEYEKSNR